MAASASVLPWCTNLRGEPSLSVSTFKRSQAKHVKKPYRVSNWPAYEAGLRRRGSLTVWLGLEPGQTSVPGWDPPARGAPKRGAQRKYSNHAIETAVSVGMVFHLPTRQTEGFLRSLFALLDLTNDIPDHTTICRRIGQLRQPPKNRCVFVMAPHVLPQMDPEIRQEPKLA